MTQQDKTFIENNRHHYNTWKQAQYINSLDGSVRSEMLAVIRRNFSAGYIADLWCSTCVTAMIEYLYTQYDKMLKDNG